MYSLYGITGQSKKKKNEGGSKVICYVVVKTLLFYIMNTL